MKRVLITLLGIAAVIAAWAVQVRATVITNTCTSTYTAINFPGTWLVSGWDTVAITTDTQPIISVKKYTKNLRTGVESDSGVVALSGDTIEFRITWSNIGGATADTVTLVDYVPTILTYISGSLSDTEVNCDTPGAAVYTASDSSIVYISRGVKGTSSPPYANGTFTFRVKVW